MNTIIYSHQDAVTYLNTVFEEKKEKNHRFSLRAWAKKIGETNAAHLSMILSRKRRLRPKLADRICQSLHLNESESHYFSAMVKLTFAESPNDKIFYQEVLATLNPEHNFSNINHDQAKILSSWVHIAILEMTHLKDFQSNPQWIAMKLGLPSNSEECATAIERLLRVGLLKKDPHGKLKKTDLNTSYGHIPSQEIRQSQADFIQQGLLALEQAPPEGREISCYTVATNSEKIVRAKGMIKEFRQQLGKFLEEDDGDTVYQVNFQLFNLLKTQNLKDITQ